MSMASASFVELEARKATIEARIAELNQVLVEQGNVGMSGPLIDDQDYPRSDIDIYRVRQVRQDINCLQNDYNEVLAALETAIGEEYERQRQDIANETSQFHEKPRHAEPAITHNLKPFMKITQVDSDSPAHEASLPVGDLVLQFGPFRHVLGGARIQLTDIAEHVKERAEKIILMNVVRDLGDESPRFVKIKLVPKAWRGHGLLGCKLVMLD